MALPSHVCEELYHANTGRICEESCITLNTPKLMQGQCVPEIQREAERTLQAAHWRSAALVHCVAASNLRCCAGNNHAVSPSEMYFDLCYSVAIGRIQDYYTYSLGVLPVVIRHQTDACSTDFVVTAGLLLVIFHIWESSVTEQLQQLPL